MRFKFAMEDMHLSARAYDRILKVGRTIADLAGSDRITADHISEAAVLDLKEWFSHEIHQTHEK